jgi:hypothetical protein
VLGVKVVEIVVEAEELEETVDVIELEELIVAVSLLETDDDTDDVTLGVFVILLVTD